MPKNADSQAGSRLPRPRRVHADAIPAKKLDRDARRVILRLQSHGHEAYFVGGCVRDLWLGCDPKDFDVATSAHPQEIRRLFRNGRIIGRRFRLVHIYYGDHIVETSTFRREPTAERDEETTEEDLLIVEDNVFGSAAEDALRRDFTVNALFLDPATHRILDYVDGMRDLERGVLRTIGDPFVRMAEDPVRIMRAVKFATRLGFRIDETTWEAMSELAPELRRSAAPRVLEEILRLMRSGTAQGAFKMLRACGALAAILPDVDAHLGPREDPGLGAVERADRFWKLLEALDSKVKHGAWLPSNAVCIAALFLQVVERQADPATRSLAGEPGDIYDVASEVIDSLANPARLSRRDFSRARRILVNQERFTLPRVKRFSPTLFCRSEDFLESLELFGLRLDARGQGSQQYEAWLGRYRDALEISDEEAAVERRRLRRRGRGRRRRPRST